MGSHQAPPPAEAKEPLLPPPADHQQPPADGGVGGEGWPAFAGKVFVVFQATLETRRFERGAPFVVVSYLHFLFFLYFYSLTRFEGTPRGSPRRDWYKPQLSALAALLAVEFAYELTGAARLTPRALEMAAAAAVIGATYAFRQRKRRNL